MRRTIGFLLACLLSSTSAAHPARVEFSQENALALCTILARDIGPRPMGSPAEQQALRFAVEKFKEYGCQESYLMPITVAGSLNTNSGIAVGVLKGRSGRIVIIGGHIDSAGPDVPGANDDASGAACVLELARVLARRQNQSTVLFCCWGGEEQGLLGSKYFVHHFAGIDSVDLMIQLDMADGAGELEIDPDTPGASSPKWLAKAACEIYYDTLGYAGLVYPTHTATLNLAAGGAYGSDHDTFLSMGIPAIDFTSDLTYPIHTPQDNLGNLTPSGLKRSGDLALGLFERFDSGVPSRSTEQYMLLQFGSRPVFLPRWVLWCCVAISVFVAIVALWISHRRSKAIEGTAAVRWSGLKLLLFTLFVQTMVWCSGSLVGVLRGYRYPWVNNVPAFVLLGILLGILALWLVLRITSRVRMSSDQFVYVRVALVLFVLDVILSSLVGPRLAAYPALSLILFSFTVLARAPVMKLFLMLAAAYPTLSLIFNESLVLTLRGITVTVGDGISRSLFYTIMYIILFTLLSLPFAFGVAAVYIDAWKRPAWTKRLRSWGGLIGIAAAIVALVLYLVGRPVYGRLWYSTVRVEQRFTLGSDSSQIDLRGSDYLAGVRVLMDGKDFTIADRTTFHRLEPLGASAVRWCSLEREIQSTNGGSVGDSLREVERTVQLHSLIRPLRVDVSYRSHGAFEITSHWYHGSRGRMRRESAREKYFSWYSFPDTNLVIPLSFRMHEGQRIAENVVITYDSLAYPLSLLREYTNFTRRTIVTAEDTVGVEPRTQLASRMKVQHYGAIDP